MPVDIQDPKEGAKPKGQVSLTSEDYLRNNILYQLFREAGVDDKDSDRSRDIKPEEIQIITYIAQDLFPGTTDSQITGVRLAYERLRRGKEHPDMPQIKGMPITQPEVPAQYGLTLDFIRDIGGLSSILVAGDEDRTRHLAGLVNEYLIRFNILTEDQGKFLIKATKGDLKDLELIANQETVILIDKNHPVAGKDFMAVVGKSTDDDGEVDDGQELVKLYSFGVRRGYHPRETDAVIKMVEYQQRIGKGLVQDLSLLNPQEGDGLSQRVIRRDVARFANLIEFAIKTKLHSSEPLAILAKAGQWYGVRQKKKGKTPQPGEDPFHDLYTNCVFALNGRPKQTILLANGLSEPSQQMAAYLQGSLGDSVYKVRMDGVATVLKDPDAEINKYQPAVMIVDPISHGGMDLIKRLDGKGIPVYAVASEQYPAEVITAKTGLPINQCFTATPKGIESLLLKIKEDTYKPLNK